MGKPDRVRLSDYDWVIINSSAGKDSQAMLDVLVKQADREGYPRANLVVAHADLGRCEWAGTKSLTIEQADHYGLRFEVEKRPQGDLLEHVEKRGMWPDSQARYCTSDHKRGQISKILTRLAREKSDLGRPVKMLNALGIRADESPARSKKKPFQCNAKASGKGRVKVVDDWYPIFDWTTEQVWKRIEASGVPHHRAYDLGMPRLSCVFCVFAPKAALLVAGRENRDLLDEYVRVERKIDHTFRNGFKIEEIRDALDSGEADDKELALVGTEDIQCWNM